MEYRDIKLNDLIGSASDGFVSYAGLKGFYHELENVEPRLITRIEKNMLEVTSKTNTLENAKAIKAYDEIELINKEFGGAD